MKVEWSVDDEAVKAVWGGLTRAAQSCGRDAKPGWLLDLGGAGGSFGDVIRTVQPGLEIVSIDIVPAKPVPGVHLIRGDVRSLPVKDGSISVVAARALLHHVPDELGKVVDEVHRTLPRGGLFVVQEPCLGNPIARMTRVAVTTTAHDEGEFPLTLDAMVVAIKKKFDVREVKPFFLLSYLMPHAVKRLPHSLRGLGLWKSRWLSLFDEKMLAGMPGMARYAAYVHIYGVRK